MTINGHGFKPRTKWKLFEVDGWQCLAWVETDDDGRCSCQISVATDDNDIEEVTISMGANGRVDIATQVWDSLAADGEKLIQTVLDNVDGLAT